MTSIKEKILEKTNEAQEIVYSYLPKAEGYQKTVLSAMNYSVRAGGKRLRPILMNETYQMFGGKDRSIIDPFMAAIEMIHTYSLIHDDLPALDNDDTRRGKPTCHVQYTEAMAILAGDGLLNFAYETASKAFRGDEQDIKTAKAMRVLASKPGIYGMIGGQTVDVESEAQPADFDTLMYIDENKTGALIECAMMIGAILAGANDEDVKRIEKIASNVGIAFQIQDDILDVTSTTEELGKPVGSDEKNQKVTYVSMKGLEQAERDVENYTNEAVREFDALDVTDPFLRELLIYLASRKK
ncbi:MAG: farnesyl diphosphate synthase [Lachnospiraceae bacterium]|nr:farnesyl diphosphate synthase [Lachnospiraceae bacterium]